MIALLFRHKLYIIRKLFTMSTHHKDVPIGVAVLQRLTLRCCPRRRFNRQFLYQSSVLLLTYISYTCYHLTRKPISVVKSVLHQNCSSLVPPPDIHITPDNNSTWCDWAPFDGSDGDATTLLGTLDSAFLFSYAIAMFFSGFVAERVNLRYFLSLGMLFSGIFSYLFGIAKDYNIHSMWYFIIVQALGGISQTTGWPGVVTVVGKWFGKGKRGLIFGIWNSHTSIGNILGTLIAARFVETDWSLSFIVPGLVMGLAGFLIFLFLVQDPVDIGLHAPDGLPQGSINTSRDAQAVNGKPEPGADPEAQIPARKDVYRRAASSSGHLSDDNDASEFDPESQVLSGEQENSACHRNHRHQGQTTIDGIPGPPVSPTESSTLLTHSSSMATTASSTSPKKAIGFVGALKIPGVIEFSLSLFFAKLVSYTFLYWLPLYIKNSTSLSASKSADLSTVFDVGGIAGGILAGVLSDWSGMSATTCACMLILAAPMMMLYEIFGTVNFATNLFLLIIVGLLVNGPYALITTAVSAELGTHSSLEGNSKALATVTAIVDGTGSIGAAIGPMLAALVSAQGWSRVFYMLIACDIIALLLLIRLVKHELQRCRQLRAGPIE